jgi:hypothetical protein
VVNAVRRRRIDLNDQKHLFGTQSAQACLLSGLLSNRVPNPDSGEALEVPQLAMAIVHNWLRHNFQSRIDPATLVQKKKMDAKDVKIAERRTKKLVDLVANLWRSASIPKVVHKDCALRFESMMSAWLELFLSCLQISDQRELYLCSFDDDDTYERTTIFPGLKLMRRKNQNHPSFLDPKITYTLSPETQVVIKDLQFQMFRKQQDKSRNTSKKTEASNGTVFKCEKGEAAVDLMLWLGRKLVLIQCRLYKKAMSTKALQEDLKNLTTHFRNKLWTTGKENGIPFVAAELGLPRIVERDVVFVLLSPSGLAKAQGKNQAAAQFWSLFEQVNATKVVDEDRETSSSSKVHAAASASLPPVHAAASATFAPEIFEGFLLVPGNKNQLNESDRNYTTWDDEILGTTFAPLVHLLELQK